MMRRMPTRNSRGVALTASAAGMLVGVFAPWVRSGAAGRSSFELFDLVERLGFADDGPFAWTVRPWPLVPLIVVGAVVTFWFGSVRLGGVLAVVGGCYVGAVSIAVANAPDSSLVRTDWGVATSGLAATVVLVLGVGELAISRSRSRGSRKRP